MRYVTTNIRLPEDLWKALKTEAAQRGKRFTELVRERLYRTRSDNNAKRTPRSLCGIWKGAEISDSAIEAAKQSLFKTK